MAIVSFTAQNFQILDCVSITPKGNVVQITGKNEQGKSTVLSSIWFAVKNKVYQPDGKPAKPRKPLRKGQRKGYVEVEFSQFIVRRDFEVDVHAVIDHVTGNLIKVDSEYEYTMRLSIRPLDGSRPPKKPQAFLDEFFSELTFDPLAFERMSAKDQFNALRHFVPDIDFDEIKALNDADFAKRTDLNRFAEQERAAAAVIILPPDMPADTVDEDAILENLDGAHKTNADIEVRSQRRADAQKRIEELRAKPVTIEAELTAARMRVTEHTEQNIARLRAEIERLEAVTTEELDRLRKVAIEQSNAAISEADELHTRLAAAGDLPERVDVEKLTEELAAARIQNARWNKCEERKQHEVKATQYEAQSAALTAAIKARDQAKTSAIASAKMPVAGLTFGDNEILLDGLPFANASSARRIRVAVAVGAAMNAKAGVMFVREGDKLDDDNMALLEQIADEYKIQLWVERIKGTADGFGVILDDGHVKAMLTNDTPEAESAGEQT